MSFEDTLDPRDLLDREAPDPDGPVPWEIALAALPWPLGRFAGAAGRMVKRPPPTAASAARAAKTPSPRPIPPHNPISPPVTPSSGPIGTPPPVSPLIPPPVPPSGPNPLFPAAVAGPMINRVDDVVKAAERPILLPSRITTLYEQVLSHILWLDPILERVGIKGEFVDCPFSGMHMSLEKNEAVDVVGKSSEAGEIAADVGLAAQNVGKVEMGVVKAAEGVGKVEMGVGKAAEEVADLTKEVVKLEVQDIAPRPPMFFYQIGKQANDVLFKEYLKGEKLVLNIDTAKIIASILKENGANTFEMQSHLQIGNTSMQFKRSSGSKLITKVTVDELNDTGLKIILTSPSHNSSDNHEPSKIEARYQQGISGITGCVQFKKKPLMSLSGVLVSDGLAVGALTDFETSPLVVHRCKLGTSITRENLTAALTMENLDALTVTCYHRFDKSTTFAAAVNHTMSTKVSTLSVGTRHDLDDLTTVKAKFSSSGVISGLVKHQWRPKSSITVCAELDVRDASRGAKFGFGLVLGP